MESMPNHNQGQSGEERTTLGNDELLRLAQSDSKAFAQLYRRNVEAVYRYLLARVGNKQNAEDLTSQTFMGALQSVSSYRGDGSAVGWLMGIARNKLADFFRQNKATLELDAAREIANPLASPDEMTERQLQIEEISRALHWLSEDRAEALALRLFGGLDAREIGRIMGKSEAAVKMLVFRAVQDLKDRLANTSMEK